MSLRAVPDRTDTSPLPYEQANAEFKEQWDLARDAYASLLIQAGSLSVPLFARSSVPPNRVRTALHSANEIVKHARALDQHISACLDIFDRAEAPTEGDA